MYLFCYYKQKQYKEIVKSYVTSINIVSIILKHLAYTILVNIIIMYSLTWVGTIVKQSISLYVYYSNKFSFFLGWNWFPVIHS